MGEKGTAKIIFQPSGRRGEVEKGINIIEASRRLGVDIEAVRPIRHMFDLAAYAFSAEESEWLRGLADEAATEAFIRIWTRKEAVVKMYRGTIAHDMDRFAVPLVSTLGTFELTPRLQDDSQRLQLIDFEFPNRRYGAVCWDGKPGETTIHPIELDFVQDRLSHYCDLLRQRA